MIFEIIQKREMFRKSKGIKSKEKGVENVRNHRKHLRNSKTQHNGLKLTQKWGGNGTGTGKILSKRTLLLLLGSIHPTFGEKERNGIIR